MEDTSTVRRGRATRTAAHDCKTCLLRRWKCDRARPRCENCQKSGKLCDGFATQLSWQPGFSTHRKPVKKKIARRAPRRIPEDSSVARQFEFINEHLTEDPEDDSSALTLAFSQSPTQAVCNVELYAQEDTGGEHDDLDEPELSMYKDSRYLDINPIPACSDELEANLQSRTHFYNDADSSICAASREAQLGHRSISDLSYWNRQSVLSNRGRERRLVESLRTIPPKVLYARNFERLEPVFERYNNEFCIIPLTSDLPFNPFRYRREALQKSEYLSRAVLALSCHHTDNMSSKGKSNLLSPTVLHHGRAALQLFRQALNSDVVMRMSSSLLDTIVVLFSLDEAYSLVGSWAVHLTGAYNILEIGGGIGTWVKDPRTVVQVALLTWWDAVISLVNRTSCVFPYEYFESVLACCDDQVWTFYGLCGCPRSLAVALVQLAHLAAEKKKSASMRWVVFDTSLVTEIEQSLEAWSHAPSNTALEDEESMHQDMDCMHCSEAWRNGLLLYIYRIFRWKSGDTPPVQIAKRARVILDHACACRDDQFVARQALLPLFFAGCELADAPAQNRVRGLCSAWNERTRYHMFGGMIPLLEDVWASQMINGSEYAWWGQAVDKMSSAESRESLQMQICFG